MKTEQDKIKELSLILQRIETDIEKYNSLANEIKFEDLLGLTKLDSFHEQRAWSSSTEECESSSMYHQKPWQSSRECW